MSLLQTLNSLRDFIKRYNTYFNEGYSNVSVIPERGIVNDGEKAVFPDDSIGNYFYLRRAPSLINFSNRDEYRISDAVNGTGISMNIFLIAYATNVDEFQLLDNLLNTLRYYTNVDLKNAELQPENVIRQELKGCHEQVWEKAIQNFPGDASLMSILFTLTYPLPFTKLNCLPNPCKEC